MKRFVVLVLAAGCGIVSGLLLAGALEITCTADASMSPALQKGAHVLVYNMAGREKDFARGDIVQFRNGLYTRTGEGSVMTKRIIGLPGDCVSIVNGIVYINGMPLDESAYLPAVTSGDNMNACYVTEGHYFVLGDNRNASTDSRDVTVGLIAEKDLQGKVMLQW